MISDMTFAIFNMCGFINVVRRFLENKPIIEKKAEDKTEVKPDSKPSDKEVDPVKKKAALEFLDKEINSLSAKKSKDSSVNSLAAKALEGLASTSKKDNENKESGWGDEEDSLKSGELDFNDLEISFD